MSKIILIILTTFLFSTNVFANEINIDSKSSVLIDANSRKILVSSNEHEKLPPASVTKVMTILLTFEALETERIKKEDVVSISSHAASMGGSQIFLEQGQNLTVIELLKSVIIASANDASVALAEYIAGSEEAFVSLMNKKAAELGMENTTFKNVTGLDTEGHLTTAYDISLMSAELVVNYPQVSEIAKIWQDTIIHKTAKGEKEFGLTNTNKLLRNYEGITGLKTGSTSEALFCVSATAIREDLSLVSVILGSPTGAIRFDEAKKLLDYGFANFRSMETEPRTVSIPVHKGSVETASVVTEKNIKLAVPKGAEVVIEEEISLPKFVLAPIQKGDSLGEIVYKIDGEEIGRGSLVLHEEVEKANILHNFKKLLK